MVSGFMFTSLFVVFFLLPLRAALRRIMPDAQIARMMGAAVVFLVLATGSTLFLVLLHHTFMHGYQAFWAFWAVYAVALSALFFWPTPYKSVP
jgi:hypothetical protein